MSSTASRVCVEIMRDRQKTFSFRTEISERSLAQMTNNIPAIDQIHKHHPHLKAKQEHGEGHPSASAPAVKMPWRPSLNIEGTWAESVVDAGLSTTAPSTQANQAKSISMPGSSSSVSGTSGVGAKIE